MTPCYTASHVCNDSSTTIYERNASRRNGAGIGAELGRFGERAQHRGDIGLGRQARHELFQLAYGLVLGERQHLLVVLASQMRLGTPIGGSGHAYRLQALAGRMAQFREKFRKNSSIRAVALGRGLALLSACEPRGSQCSHAADRATHTAAHAGGHHGERRISLACSWLPAERPRFEPIRGFTDTDRCARVFAGLTEPQ